MSIRSFIEGEPIVIDDPLDASGLPDPSAVEHWFHPIVEFEKMKAEAEQRQELRIRYDKALRHAFSQKGVPMEGRPITVLPTFQWYGAGRPNRGPRSHRKLAINRSRRSACTFEAR